MKLGLKTKNKRNIVILESPIVMWWWQSSFDFPIFISFGPLWRAWWILNISFSSYLRHGDIILILHYISMLKQTKNSKISNITVSSVILAAFIEVRVTLQTILSPFYKIWIERIGKKSLKLWIYFWKQAKYLQYWTWSNLNF